MSLLNDNNSDLFEMKALKDNKCGDIDCICL